MFVFNIFLIGLLVVFGLGYFLFSGILLLGPIKYNSWIKIKRGFYSGFSGQVKNANFFKYLIRLHGREVNNALTDKLNKSIRVWWFNLELADKPTELVKEDFYNEITRDWNAADSYLSIATSFMSTSLSVSEEEYKTS